MLIKICVVLSLVCLLVKADGPYMTNIHGDDDVLIMIPNGAYTAISASLASLGWSAVTKNGDQLVGYNNSCKAETMKFSSMSTKEQETLNGYFSRLEALTHSQKARVAVKTFWFGHFNLNPPGLFSDAMAHGYKPRLLFNEGFQVLALSDKSRSGAKIVPGKTDVSRVFINDKLVSFVSSSSIYSKPLVCLSPEEVAYIKPIQEAVKVYRMLKLHK